VGFHTRGLGRERPPVVCQQQIEDVLVAGNERKWTEMLLPLSCGSFRGILRSFAFISGRFLLVMAKFSGSRMFAGHAGKFGLDGVSVVLRGN
jgi:hypothetical protein